MNQPCSEKGMGCNSRGKSKWKSALTLVQKSWFLTSLNCIRAIAIAWHPLPLILTNIAAASQHRCWAFLHHPECNHLTVHRQPPWVPRQLMLYTRYLLRHFHPCPFLALHFGHSWSRTDNVLGTLVPHPEQSTVVLWGLTLTKCTPLLRATASSLVRNLPHATS